MSEFPSSLCAMNATWLPSGDHDGVSIQRHPSVSRRPPLPSIPMVAIRGPSSHEPHPAISVARVTNAIVLPSGESAVAKASTGNPGISPWIEPSDPTTAALSRSLLGAGSAGDGRERMMFMPTRTRARAIARPPRPATIRSLRRFLSRRRKIASTGNSGSGNSLPERSSIPL